MINALTFEDISRNFDHTKQQLQKIEMEAIRTRAIVQSWSARSCPFYSFAFAMPEYLWTAGETLMLSASLISILFYYTYD